MHVILSLLLLIITSSEVVDFLSDFQMSKTGIVSTIPIMIGTNFTIGLPQSISIVYIMPRCLQRF